MKEKRKEDTFFNSLAGFLGHSQQYSAVISGSELRNDSRRCSENPMGCRVLHAAWLRAVQEPYPLSYLSSKITQSFKLHHYHPKKSNMEAQKRLFCVIAS